jgi:hypothetical protein
MNGKCFAAHGSYFFILSVLRASLVVRPFSILEENIINSMSNELCNQL